MSSDVNNLLKGLNRKELLEIAEQVKPLLEELLEKSKRIQTIFESTLESRPVVDCRIECPTVQKLAVQIKKVQAALNTEPTPEDMAHYKDD